MTTFLLFFLAGLTAISTVIFIMTLYAYVIQTHIPYIPSKTSEFERFLDETQFPPNSTLFDLGSGDGRILFLAEKAGLRVKGYEIAIFPYLLSIAHKFIHGSRATIHYQDYRKGTLEEANYIFAYLLTKYTQEAFRKAEKECKPGTYFICNTFQLESRQPLKIYYDRKQKPKLFIYQI